MLGRKGGRAAKKGRRVWLLGRHHPGADRSIKWDGSFGNLSDPDVVIVDLTGLTRDVLQRIDKGNLDQAQASIWDKLLYGGTVVVITQPEFSIRPGSPPTGRPAGAYGRADAAGPCAYSNYHILPINIVTTAVQPNHVIKASDGHRFKGYIDAVKGYNFLINVDKNLPPHSASEPPAKLRWSYDMDITNNSGRVLGLVLEVKESNHCGHLRRAPRPGHLVLLPPPTDQIGEAIGRILSVYKASPPAWAERLSPGPASGNRARIADLEERKAEIQGEIDGLARQNGRILAHRRLLYSDGPELEDAVVEAFRALGFNDIERMGDRDEEDASFGMGGTRYSRAVVEAKGAGKGAKMRHILQCSMWAAKRAAADDKPIKGILVSNQHRFKPYPESSKVRTKIESNQLEQAEMDDVCIIPSCVLFEAVDRVLGGEAPDRAGISARIAATKGVLRNVF